MPGVPSGRGCEACRKQKKKCNQAKPSCSRCARLEISCNGNGLQRFKFMEKRSLIDKPRTRHGVMGDTNLPPQYLRFTTITWAPSSESTMMTSAFCSVLGVTDVRYNLSVYGEFLKDIPRRLGTNAALDASVGAVIATFPDVYSSSRRRSVKAYEGYGHALKVLRECLNDPVQAGSVDTICAVYLILLCQGWLGDREDSLGHIEALAYLLKVAAYRSEQDEFETVVTITLCVPVIVESIANPKIQLHPWIEKLTEKHDSSLSIESLKLKHLVRLPDFINFPHLHLSKIRTTYQQLRKDLPAIYEIVESASEAQMSTLHSRYQTIYVIQLAFSAILNTILRTYDPADMNLIEQSIELVDEMIKLTEGATAYRPLGASGMPVCLICAWPATEDPMKRARMEELFSDYATDFPVAPWMKIALWLEKKLKHSSLDQCLSQLTSLGYAELTEPVEVLPETGYACSVM